MVEGGLNLLADQWSGVIAAKGESDERRQFKPFQDHLNDLNLSGRHTAI
jgi:hypothetical protein